MKKLYVAVLFCLMGATSFAADHETVPELPGHLRCLNGSRQSIGYNNKDVATWETTTRNQFRARGLVQGKITQLYPSKNGHTHFGIGLGIGKGIEVIYNDEFGELPQLSLGMDVVACGDYITVSANAALPSPMPAIIHWIHYNPGSRDGGKHPDGFLIINGMPYGHSSSASARNGN